MRHLFSIKDKGLTNCRVISKICSVTLTFYNHEFKKSVLCAHLDYFT